MIRPPNEFPKGMIPTAPEKAPEPPAPLTLADGNYAGAIRQALDILPVEVRVDRCVIVERAGRHPDVRLSLTILGEKGGEAGERDGSPVQSSVEDVHGPGS